nr:immunoglobulin heavy chain junction region [Mus musculus]
CASGDGYYEIFGYW